MKQLTKKELSIIYVFLSTIFSESIGQSCPGTTNGLSTSGSREDMLKRITKRFSKCTIIEGNLEISYLPLVESDLTFLSTIEEVTGYVIFYDTSQTSLPFTNLKIIRGRNLYSLSDGSYSLIIIYNKFLKDLRLLSLKEISRGDVMFSKVDNLCYIDTVLWRDIFSIENSTVKYDTLSIEQATPCKGTCHESCPKFNRMSYCWGPGEHQCQKLTKSFCHERCNGSCFGKEWYQCCADTCEGGCTGTSNKECFRCKTFSDGGACVDFCPPPAIYDSTSMTWKSNPMFKYPFGSECVSQCPDYTYVYKGACVKNCPEGETDTEGVCKPCEGPCPKGCPGTGDTFLSNRNIESFRGCTVIQGNLYIAQTTFKKEYDYVPLTYDDLSLLENVTVIEGSVRIEADSPLFRNLSFLRNLKTIVGNQILKRGFGLAIFLTSLEFLGLDSLHSILNGKLIIITNKRLCYVEKFDWKNIRKNHQDVMVNNNRDISECESEGKVCHQECAENSCLGPFDTNCDKCRNLKQGNKCVRSCDLGWFSQSLGDGSKECLKCHKECRESCFGPGSDECHKCLHFKDGPNCVESCPEGSQTCTGRPEA